ncbi:MAG: sensor domain-containing diguanylate cyclase [Phycisphaerales bacterium]
MIIRTLKSRPRATHRSALYVGLFLMAVSVCVGLVGLFGLHVVREHVSSELRRHHRAQVLLDRIGASMASAQQDFHSAVAATDAISEERWLASYARHTQVVRETLKEYVEGAGDDVSRSEHWIRFEESLGAWVAQGESMAGEDATLPKLGASGMTPVTVYNQQFQEALQDMGELQRNTHHPAIEAGMESVENLSRVFEGVVIGVVILGLAVGGVVLRESVGQIVTQEDAIASQSEQLRDEAGRQEFVARVTRGLEMARSEEEAFGLACQVVASVAPRTERQLLLSDSSSAHLRPAHGCDEERLCGVEKPFDCPAVRRGQAQVFKTSEAFDACPFLRGRAGGACSALCVPLTVMGRGVGVIHLVGADGEAPSTAARQMIEHVGESLGSRVGMIRAFRQTTLQATVDPLTGLLNRRSLETEMAELLNAGTTYTVVFTDIDHFKRLNDTHGHETGDRALRLFAGMLRERVRSHDLVARWGGEEFILVLSGVRKQEAVGLVERIRTGLGERLSGGTVPRFTASYGVADSEDAPGFEEVVDIADRALLAAKARGRDRVVLAGEGAEGEGADREGGEGAGEAAAA